MKKLGILVENNPYSEVGGKGKYPCLRALLGTFVSMSKILDTKISFICMNKATVQKNKDLENDISYLDKIGVEYEILPYDTEEEFEVLVGSIMQYRPLWQYQVFDTLASRSKKVIYIDSDHEPTVKARSVFNQVDALNLKHLKEKLKYVITNESVFKNEWKEKVPGLIETVFLPLLHHPYYMISERVVPESHIFDTNLGTAMRTGESESIQNILREYNIYQMTNPGLFSRTLVNMEDLHIGMKGRVFIGTMLSNSGDGSHYRSTTKIMESLFSGVLPTVIDYKGSEPEERYPYLKLIPRELKVLKTEKYVDRDEFRGTFEFVKSLSKSEFCNLVNELYSEVYEYHHPDKWKDELRRILL